MSQIAIKVENLSKMYRLGEVGTGTISHDLNRWWAHIRGKEDPFAKVGQINDRTQKAEKGEYVWALKNIDFEVKQGEVLGIIGKNGAGKSTLLKLLSQITAPTTGTIKAKGRIASLLEVGTGMHPEMTGKENVYLNGTILGMSKREIACKFDDIMDFAGCAKYADTPVKRYSSGMKVRLGFAVAAFLEPEILIVDEVLAVGDAEFQKRAIGKMQEVSQSEGRTVLFVSHNMTSIVDLCSKSILLEKGEISIIGETIHVIEKYLNSSNSSINGKFINTNVVQEDKEIYLCEASIFNASKTEVGTLYYQEPFTIKTIWKTTRDIDLQIDAWIKIYNSEGLFITALNTRSEEIYFTDKGIYTLKVTLENVLAPGTYYMDFGIKPFHDKVYDFHEKCLNFRIDETPYYQNSKFLVKNSKAIIGLKSNWSSESIKYALL